MRVLMVCPELPRANAPGSMAPAARQIQSLRDLGLAVDVVDMHGIPKLKYLLALPRIRRLARQVDVIHAHFGYCGWLARLAPLLSRVQAPLVVSFMGDDLLGTPYNAAGDLTRFSRWMVSANRVLARSATRVIVKSAEMAKVIAPVSSTVIPNGVDLGTFHPQDRTIARMELDLPQDRGLVLFPGDPVNPRKGHALASAAIAVATRRLNAPIDLVPLWGVSPQKVATYMNACDAMLMTSLIEGSPNVVKEALGCNVPIVAVPVGDVPEMLDGVTGAIVCPRDADLLGEQVAARLAVPAPSNGRDVLIRRGLDLEQVARRVVDVYEQALGRRIEREPSLPMFEAEKLTEQPALPV